MAGDWIKMRVNLVSHPKVLALAEFLADNGDYQDWSTMAGFVPAMGGSPDDYERDFQSSLRVTRYVAVCALLRFWGYANEHAKDEFIGSLRLHDIDDVVQVPGFGAALDAIGWAEYDPERRGLSLPNFNEYNASANDRGAADRQKRYRERQKSLTQKSDVTGDVTRHDREEKRREEKTPTAKAADGFAEFWQAYPNHTAKANALKAWGKVPAELHPAIMAAVLVQKRSAAWTKDGGQFVPHAATWLNGQRWDDQPTVADRADIFSGAL